MKTEQRSSGALQLGQGDTVEPRRSSESTLSSLVAFCGISLILLAAMLLTSPATSAAQPGAPAALPFGLTHQRRYRGQNVNRHLRAPGLSCAWLASHPVRFFPGK